MLQLCFLLGYGSEGVGKRETTDSGLMFMGVRAFNPVTGQFLSQDPVPGGNETAYNYPNDPINGSDLTGLAGPMDQYDWMVWGLVTVAVIGLTAGACVASAGVFCVFAGYVFDAGGSALSAALSADHHHESAKQKTEDINDAIFISLITHSPSGKLSAGLFKKTTSTKIGKKIFSKVTGVGKRIVEDTTSSVISKTLEGPAAWTLTEIRKLLR